MSREDAKSSTEMRLLYNGASVSELGLIFDMSSHEVNRRIVGKVIPLTAEAKVPKYRIRDAAPYLCNVVFDPEEFIRNLTPSKMPPALSDAFWKGQRNKQKWEEDRGDLWRTERVISVLADVFKSFRMTVQMFGDTLEQQEELTPRQRQIIQDLGDGLILSAQQSLVDEFKDYVPADDEHGAPLTEEEANIIVDRHGESEPFDDGFGD